MRVSEFQWGSENGERTFWEPVFRKVSGHISDSPTRLGSALVHSPTLKFVALRHFPAEGGLRKEWS